MSEPAIDFPALGRITARVTGACAVTSAAIQVMELAQDKKERAELLRIFADEVIAAATLLRAVLDQKTPNDPAHE